MIIESSIKLDGVTKAHIHIAFLENVKLTTNKYWYEIWIPGAGEVLFEGEFIHKNDNPIELVKKALERTK